MTSEKTTCDIVDNKSYDRVEDRITGMRAAHLREYAMMELGSWS